MKKGLALLVCMVLVFGGLLVGCSKSQQSDAKDPARPEAIEDLNQILPPPDASGRVGGGQPAPTKP